jgi:hypothetical protein
VYRNHQQSWWNKNALAIEASFATIKKVWQPYRKQRRLVIEDE